MPDKIHARLTPAYDMQNKFDSTKILRDWQDIPTHNKTYESLSFVCDKIENAIHNKNMDLAETWLKRAYARLEKLDVKHPVSETELKKYLNDKSKVLKFTRQLNKMAKAAAAVMKYEAIITKSIILIKDLKALSWSNNDNSTASRDDKAKQLKANRDQLREGYAKMKVAMDAINILGELAPPGMDSMIEFSADVFKGAEKTVKFTYDYAEQIEAWIKDAGKLGNVRGSNEITTSKTLQFIDKNKRAHKNLTTDQYLDLVLGRPR
ncbi:MAG: hypothetical protein PHH77_09235 [Victivallaceae bacterium]|nr:hypothetical protein [Victivallaceae bacterium]